MKYLLFLKEEEIVHGLPSGPTDGSSIFLFLKMLISMSMNDLQQSKQGLLLNLSTKRSPMLDSVLKLPVLLLWDIFPSYSVVAQHPWQDCMVWQLTVW